MDNVKSFAGELIGTFLMCFCGIGAVATATLYGSLTGPGQVGLVWGVAIAIAIFITRNLSAAHFNPAVSLGMCVAKRMKWRELPIYLIGQCAGAFIAAGALWLLFADSVALNLAATGATMNTAEVGSAASIWIELYPNTADGVVSFGTAALAEGIGVFILVLVIFSITSTENVGRAPRALAPLFIGLTVTIIINVVGPLTDAGLNPARDIMPRLWACLVGWDAVAFGTSALETCIVYIIGPLVGGVLAALCYKYLLSPLHLRGAAADEEDGSPQAKTLEIEDNLT